MIRRVFMLLLLLLTAAPTLAQTQPVTPTFADYVTALEALPSALHLGLLRGAVAATILDRYPNIGDETYTTLRRAYAWIPDNERNPMIIQAWFRENQPTLRGYDHLTFDDYDIWTTPRDFNTDGTDEYVLEAIKGRQEGQSIDRAACTYPAEYVAYLVAEQIEDDYRIITPPLTWQSRWLDPRWDWGGGGLSEVRFEDINADGLPEWLLIRGGLIGCMSGQCVVSGDLEILGWRDGELRHLTDAVDRSGRSPLSYSERHFAGGCSSMPRTVDWQITNTDLDPAYEIIQREYNWTNWGCRLTTTHIIDWNEVTNLYERVPDSQATISADSRQCHHQQAEEAMWAGDYQEAITLYERALVTPLNEIDRIDVGDQINPVYISDDYNPYFIGRLALAYILTGQDEQARTALALLDGQTIQDEAISLFIAVLAPLTDQPLQACIAAYDVFTEHVPNAYLGVTGINFSSINPTSYMPERIGCDAPALIDHLLETTTFPVNESPLDGLERLGLAVRRSLTTDFDADGRDEWLVWLETPVYPVLFAPANERYAVSRPAVDIYGDGQEITVRELPDDFGSILAYVRDYSEGGGAPPWARRYYIDGYGGYAPYHCSQHEMKTLWLWYFDGSELYSDWFTVCQDHLEALFSADGRTINGGVLISHCPDYGGVCTGAEISNQWVWDVVQGRYVPPPVSRTPTPIATPVPTIVPPTLEPPSEYDAQAAWRSEDYAEYIAITDVLLPTLTDNPEQVFGLRYRRGLAFELLGQPERALAEYQAIYDQALGVYDDWAALAAIHLPE